MVKIDWKDRLKPLYQPSAKQVSVVEVPEMNYLMVDGQGNPNTSQAYQEAVEALYSVSYSLKFAVKKMEAGVDYAVMPLEGLWWMEGEPPYPLERKDEFQWIAMIAQPEWVTPELFSVIREQVILKKKPPGVARLRFEPFSEGQAAQILHIGPYSAEAPTVEQLYSFITAGGYRLHGRHHEIYLSDPNRTAPEKLKTILRQPFV